MPRDLKSGERRPAILFFHGGSRRQMLLAWHYMAYYHNTYAMNQFLASRGYIVLSVNYRSGTGYGLELPRGAQLRRDRRERVQRRARRGALPEAAAGRRSAAHRRLRRLVRRLSDRARAGARLGSVRRRRGHSRRPRLERRHPHLHAELRPRPGHRRAATSPSSPLQLTSKAGARRCCWCTATTTATCRLRRR